VHCMICEFCAVCAMCICRIVKGVLEVAIMSHLLATACVHFADSASFGNMFLFYFSPVGRLREYIKKRKMTQGGLYTASPGEYDICCYI